MKVHEANGDVSGQKLALCMSSRIHDVKEQNSSVYSSSNSATSKRLKLHSAHAFMSHLRSNSLSPSGYSASSSSAKESSSPASGDSDESIVLIPYSNIAPYPYEGMDSSLPDVKCVEENIVSDPKNRHVTPIENSSLNSNNQFCSYLYQSNNYVPDSYNVRSISYQYPMPQQPQYDHNHAFNATNHYSMASTGSFY